MKFKKLLTMLALAASLLASAAQAAPVSTTIDGTASIGTAGIIGYTGTVIGLGTTFTLPSGSAFPNLSYISSTTGQFAGVEATPLVFSAVTATLNAMVQFTSAVGDFVGQIALATVSGATTNRIVSITVLGDFTPSGILDTYLAGPASLTMSFTQTGGAGASVSVSATLASPPVPIEVPEPMTLALLGVAIAGLGAVASRRKAA
ncbi:PEP-CTERM sorting domain-containing protein [Siccirubricoccus sp. KC 17139]|uniref:PEP-CTERM sorting domain-containing protein n=1 Tax=Siccirubricoccus soli TaxID=2899147 RepID=A0ABT1D9V6_9PROT|nr:PEP-CTERM sorting domain-containing protein [Siccirubricoccus soli]MCO6418715.1 PEP-CTERM sorting domain-containing protein [Siccirubricoccus soli]MCP2684850.1 PEP-CTERM sorting domain-containing protein [Siccirubricoccus soli]